MADLNNTLDSTLDNMTSGANDAASTATDTAGAAAEAATEAASSAANYATGAVGTATNVAYGYTQDFATTATNYMSQILDGTKEFASSDHNKVFWVILMSSFIFTLLKPIFYPIFGLTNNVDPNESVSSKFKKMFNGGVLFSLFILSLMFAYPETLDFLNISQKKVMFIPYRYPERFINTNNNSNVISNKKRSPIEIY